MEIAISNINDIRVGIDSDISKFILENLHPNDQESQGKAYNRLISFISSFKDDLTVIAETDYIDKTYRDLYYHFYSTKLCNYERNCVRISFCTNKVNETITHSEEDIKKLKENYLGFVVLRPLGFACIGRNTLSPYVRIDFGNQNLLCLTKVQSTVLGSKVQIEGFPHSSQDGEMMTCAETTIWCIMSYLANRYNNYAFPLGHNILASLTDTSYQRQTPSIGLNFQQISISLQHQGLSCRVYDKTNPAFKEILSCYIESGIPLALCLESTSFGHAVACIGRKKIDRNTIHFNHTTHGKYYEWNHYIDTFVVNDDNVTPYQQMSYIDPCSYYGDPDWANMNITHFIAPLHHKIYLDAELAREASLILVQIFGYDDDSVIRTFLTSSRSYRDFIVNCSDLSDQEKDVFMELEMPKFVWITEISDCKSFNQHKVNHLLLIDATSGQSDILKSIILYTKDGEINVYDKHSHNFVVLPINFCQNFQSFTNLK